MQSPNDVDAILARELYGLSYRDRNNIQEEIHGVTSLAPTLSPQQIDDALERLQAEVERLPPAQRRGYDRAVSIRSHYILNDRNFRIKFLRADLFHARAAASRFTKHVDFLLDFFGEDALKRPLRLNDLTKADQDFMRLGKTQVLSSRDRAGRLVVFHQRSMLLVPMSTLLKEHFYIFSVVSDDVSTQMHGVVMVMSAEKGLADDNVNDPDTERGVWVKFLQAMPVRIAAMHISLPDGPAFILFRTLLMLDFFDMQKRARTKFYKGSRWTTESRYQLLTYGVPVHDFPVTQTGVLQTKHHLQWMRTREIIDDEDEAELVRTTQSLGGPDQFGQWMNHPINRGISSTSLSDGAPTSSMKSTRIFHPGVHDVLFSKGGNPGHHGNKEFRNLIECYLDEYQRNADREERHRIRQKIIDFVIAEPRCGRFLEMQKGNLWWTVMTDKDAIDWKVSVAIYDRNRSLEARKNRQNSESDTSKFSGLDGKNNKRRKLLCEDGSCDGGQCS